LRENALLRNLASYALAKNAKIAKESQNGAFDMEFLSVLCAKMLTSAGGTRHLEIDGGFGALNACSI
jgi:hypothetical protein